MIPDGRSLAVPEESPSCTERGCPVKAGEARVDACRQSRSAWRVHESNRNHSAAGTWRLKRAILPAAISDRTVCRLLAKVRGREQVQRTRPVCGLREMIARNRTRLTVRYL